MKGLAIADVERQGLRVAFRVWGIGHYNVDNMSNMVNVS